MGGEVKEDKPAKLTSEQLAEQAKIITSTYWTDHIVWVFAPEGKWEGLAAPLLTYPKMGVKSSRNNKGDWVKIRDFPIPEGVDPVWYALEWLKIDPLLMVDQPSKAEVPGIHEYGFFTFNFERTAIQGFRWQNDQGLFTDMFLLRRAPFKPTTAIAEIPFSDFKSLEGFISEYPPNAPFPIDQDYEDIEEAQKEFDKSDPNFRWRSFIRTRELDWKGTLSGWLEFAKDPKARLTIQRNLYIGSEFHLKKWNFSSDMEFNTLDAPTRRLLYLLPHILIMEDGTIRDFITIRKELIKLKKWDELKHHLNQVKDLIGSKVGPLSPHELYLVALSCY